MRYRIPIVIVCGVIALLGATVRTVSAQTPGVLLGTVVVEGSRKPVASARITLQRVDGPRKMALVSDAQGRFAHVGVRPGFYTVIVECDGYAPVEVLGVEIRTNDKVRLAIDATPSEEAPFTRRILRYRRPLVNIEDATMSTRIH